MDYTIYEQLVEREGMPKGNEERSLYRALETVTDGRARRGVRYSVALVLTLLLLGKLAGETKPSGIAHWARLRKGWLKERLGLTSDRLPCAATYTYVLERVDAEELTQVIRAYTTRLNSPMREEGVRVQARQEHETQTRHLALDGKTLRGTLKHDRQDQPKHHLLALYEVETGVVLAQRQVKEKDNEISTAPGLLAGLPLAGRIITADAMQTQVTFMRALHRQHADVILIAKDNQPQLHADLALYFEDPQADRTTWLSETSTSKGHGRLETRIVTATPDLAAYFADRWEGIAQVFRVERRVIDCKTGKSRTEVAYGITTLSPAQAPPQRLGQLVRRHWGIENRLHYRRDVTLGEDACQVRTGDAPHVLAVLNNAVLSLMDWLHVTNVPEQMRIFDARCDQALFLLIAAW
jgi:predicted transposase YbfD/YdcC